MGGMGGGGSAGHPSEGATGGAMTTGNKAPKVPKTPEKPRNAIENGNVCLRMYPAEIDKYHEVLKAKLEKVKGAADVLVDTNANWVNLRFTAKDWDDVKRLENASNEVAVPARVISPATVEFALLPLKGAKLDKKAFEEKLRATSLYDYDLGATLKISTNLMATHWGNLFGDAADCGYTLDPKSHCFHKVAVKNAGGEAPTTDEFTAKLYRNKGVLLIGANPDKKGYFGIITTNEVPEKELFGILKDLGWTAEKFE